VSEEQDWRLKVELGDEARRGVLDTMLGRVHQPRIGPGLPHDVVVTHDAAVMFAYAATRPSLDAARRAIETALQEEGRTARLSVSHWDEGSDEWLQVDPPLTDVQRRAEDAVERDQEQQESRTLVISSGKMIRAEVEQTMRDCAARLGIECEVIEHPHLLTTQVAFTVTGSRRKLNEFAEGLRAEELATMRTEREVMISPL
jgi:hypothetical protein